MANISKGVNKQLAYKRETTWGVPAGDTGGKLLRRVTGNFNLTKASYQSNEINPHYQVVDFRHGTVQVDGSLSTELSPGTYSEFMAAVVAKDFVTAGTEATLSVTIAASGDFYTITRSSGTWLASGLHVGNVVTMTGAGLNVANVSNNVLIASMTALVLTVVLLSDTPLVAEGPITPVTVTAIGKETIVPSTAHTDDSFTVEEYYDDIAQSEVFTGMKVGSFAVSIPSTGLVTSTVTLTGKNMTTATSQYYTTPTATNTNGIFAGVSGAMIVNGLPVALITSMDFTMDRGLEVANAVGTDSAVDIFTGVVNCTGNFSTYFQNGVFRDYFKNESVISLVVALSTSSDKDADCITFTFPKVKVNTATKADSMNGIIQSQSFQALLNDVSTNGTSLTTVQIQDTTL